MFKSWHFGTCFELELLKKFIFFCKYDSFYLLIRGYWDTIPAESRLPRYNIYMKIISISQTLAVWQVDKNQKIGKFSSFFEPDFASQKSHHRISKIPTAQIYFSRRFKICNLILPSLLGNGRINMYFQRFWGIFFSIFSKFNPSDRRGRSQFKISPIPWLEHIPMEHLWEKSWQNHCKTKKKKNDPSEFQS